MRRHHGRSPRLWRSRRRLRHGREHSAFNEHLAKLGYPALRVDRILRRSLEFRQRHVAPIAAVPAAPYGARTPGPVWATSPYDCFTDEGYGRYLPCSSGRDQ